jgi:hypothetical protein
MHSTNPHRIENRDPCTEGYATNKQFPEVDWENVESQGWTQYGPLEHHRLTVLRVGWLGKEDGINNGWKSRGRSSIDGKTNP